MFSFFYLALFHYHLLSVLDVDTLTKPWILVQHTSVKCRNRARLQSLSLLGRDTCCTIGYEANVNFLEIALEIRDCIEKDIIEIKFGCVKWWWMVAWRAQKEKKVFKKVFNKNGSYWLLATSTSLSVGITGLEPATSRPPDVCATNCAKSRKRVQNYTIFLNWPNLLPCFFVFGVIFAKILYKVRFSLVFHQIIRNFASYYI